MDSSVKNLIKWLLVGLVIIGGFLAMIFANQGGTPDDGKGDIPPVTNNEWIKGGINVRATLVEYSDFQCPACKFREPMIQQLLDEFGNQIKFVYRHFPLSAIHKNGQLAAQAGEAAGLQNKFWEMHGKLFENQEIWADQDDDEAKDTFIDYAEQIGLDKTQFESDLDSNAVRDAVNEDYSGGVAAGVNSTPSFFLNGQYVKPNSYDEFSGLIRQAISSVPAN